MKYIFTFYITVFGMSSYGCEIKSPLKAPLSLTIIAATSYIHSFLIPQPSLVGTNRTTEVEYSLKSTLKKIEKLSISQELQEMLTHYIVYSLDKNLSLSCLTSQSRIGTSFNKEMCEKETCQCECKIVITQRNTIPTLTQLHYKGCLPMINGSTTIPLQLSETFCCTFIHLTELKVNHTSLSFLPENIHNLYSLKILNIAHNELASIPYNLRLMKHLLELYINNNPFLQQYNPLNEEYYNKFPYTCTQAISTYLGSAETALVKGIIGENYCLLNDWIFAKEICSITFPFKYALARAMGFKNEYLNLSALSCNHNAMH